MKITIQKDNEKAQELDSELMIWFSCSGDKDGYLTAMGALTDDDKSEEEFAIAQRATLIAMCELISMNVLNKGKIAFLMEQAIEALNERTKDD